MIKGIALGCVVVLGLLAALPARADEPEFALTIKNHQFVPAELQIPAGIKVKIIVKNEDPTPSEFESNELHREKVVPPGQSISVFVGPLDPGSYGFFDDFHPESTGRLIVK